MHLTYLIIIKLRLHSVDADIAMTCVVGFYYVVFATAMVHALQVAELRGSPLESGVHHQALEVSGKAQLNIPGAFGNATEEEERADRNSAPLFGNETHGSAHTIVHQDRSASNRSKDTEYTISTPQNAYIYLKNVHTADDYHFFELETFSHPAVNENWRPTAEQNHFLWYVIGPDNDGDVRIMNVKFRVMLTVKRKVGLLTSTTWVGACSESAQSCPAQWLLYGVSNPDPEETDSVFVFHQSQNFMHHDVPAVTRTPYRTNLWRFNPPIASSIIRRPLTAEEW